MHMQEEYVTNSSYVWCRMTRSAKLRERFKSRPADFTWDDLVRLLADFGYEMVAPKATSARLFICKGRAKISLHKPHDHVLKKYQVSLVLEVLENEGLM